MMQASADNPVEGNITYSEEHQGNSVIEWKVRSFSTQDCDVGKVLFSDSFFLGNSEKSYRIAIFPGGYEQEDTGFISCFIVSTGKNFYVKSWIILSNIEGDEFGRAIVEIKPEVKDKLSRGGIRKMACRKYLLSRLPQDILVVSVDCIFSTTSSSSTRCGHFQNSELTPFVKLSNDLSMLYEKPGESADISVSVNGLLIPVHSSLLRARSPVFAAMLDEPVVGDVGDGSPRMLEVTDFGYETIKLLLWFLYSASLEHISVSQAHDLLQAAHKYEVCGLLTHCSNVLIARMNSENVVKVLIAADSLNITSLRSVALQYFCQLEPSEFDKRLSELIDNGDTNLLYSAVRSMNSVI